MILSLGLMMGIHRTRKRGCVLKTRNGDLFVNWMESNKQLGIIRKIQHSALKRGMWMIILHVLNCSQLMFGALSIYLYLSLSISIYLYLSISIYIYLSLSISIYIYLYLSISIYIYLSIHPSIYPQNDPSTLAGGHTIHPNWCASHVPARINLISRLPPRSNMLATSWQHKTTMTGRWVMQRHKQPHWKEQAPNIIKMNIYIYIHIIIYIYIYVCIHISTTTINQITDHKM